MIIGFCGKAGAGKDTAALVFKDYDSEFFSFAKILKDTVRLLFCLSDEQLTDRILKESVDERWGKSPRQLLQTMGSYVRDNIGENTFVNILQEKVNGSSKRYKIITDVRYPNECEMIKRMGGIIIKIERPELSNNDLHCSENQNLSLYIDHTVLNVDSIELLHKTIADLVIDPR